MEQEVCTNFKSIRAKFQEEIQGKYRPVLPEKPKRLPTYTVSCSAPITLSSCSAVEFKTPNQAQSDPKAYSGKRPISFPKTLSEVSSSGDGQNRQSLKIRRLPLVLPVSDDSSAPAPPKGVISPLKFIKKPIPTPFSLTKVSVCTKEYGKNGKNGLGLVKHSSIFNSEEPANTEAVDLPQSTASNSASPCASLENSPNESLTDSSSSSVTHFFDHQHVLSTLEKAKRKLNHKNLMVCGRPKGFSCSKALVLPNECPSSPAKSKVCRPENSPLKITGNSHSFITAMKLSGFIRPERQRKTLPDLTSLGPVPFKPARPPHVDLSKYKSRSDVIHTNNTLATESVPENETLTVGNAALDESLPPPEFPDFDMSAPEAADSSAINLAALELEATEILASDLSPPAPAADEDNNLDSQSSEEKRNVGVLPLTTETVTSDLRVNGSHTNVSLSSEQQRSSEPVSSQSRRFHEPFDNVYEDVEAVPKFPVAQSSLKYKGAPKNPYADNSSLKEETWRTIWHVPQWSNPAEDQNGHTQHDRKKQSSPDHHEDKEQKKKEKQRLEKEKKEQKEKDKKRNELHKKFKITGLEEPMYHARVLADSKLRKYDLPVKSGDLISIIRTVNCPKGKWLARDANNKYGYISVMNVELNIKEMLELGKKVSQAAGRGQTDGDNISFSSRSSHQNQMFTSSFTDDSEEWMYEDDTFSLSTENLSQNRAASLPDILDSNSFAAHTFSDWSIEDHHAQEVENFQFADIDLLPPPALYADSL
ncbi:uncharacterized protein isoform X1 [Danio rerio]|uniref:Si:ch211-188c16.1 n=2 Tax=Danio rerio TaxID=7955 RepID=B3DHD5_DANRE|nr:uncharacterized protein LOC562677 [Danio rerio]AAI62725.1 Si:ch211-188c16.1 protein [Danio rerio]|eukprot:NP_001170918.1 uncharacterized protein C1orf168 homolog [Danio rerio]